MAVESNTQLGLAGTTDSNEDEATNAWGAQHLEEMQALEGMDPEDQRAIESYERRQMEGKGVPLGEPMWGGGPPDQDAGVIGDTAALAAALVVGGLSDTIGAIPAGAAGLTALTAEAVTGTTPSGKDFYGEENVSEAGRVVESISNVWNEYITKNALEAVMPESLEDDTEEMHHRVQSVFMMGMDAVARGAAVITAPAVLTLASQGVDTSKFRAGVDAHARSSATLAMLLLGMRSLPGQKGGKAGMLTPEEMDLVLGNAARETAAKYNIDPDVQAPASQTPAGMPSYASYQAGKRAGPAEQFGAPPQRGAPEGPPVQGELPLNEPHTASGRGPIAQGNIPRHPTSPTKGQMNLPFEEGYAPRSPAARPMVEYHLEGEWLPAEAPFQPLTEFQTRNIYEGTYENLTPTRAPQLEKLGTAQERQMFRRKGHEQFMDPATFPWRESMQRLEMHGKRPYPRPVFKTKAEKAALAKAKKDGLAAERKLKAAERAAKKAAKEESAKVAALAKAAVVEAKAEVKKVIKRFKTLEERQAKGQRIPAEEFDWRNAREVDVARRSGVDPFPEKAAPKKAPNIREELAPTFLDKRTPYEAAQDISNARKAEPTDIQSARDKKLSKEPLYQDSAGRYNRELTEAETRIMDERASEVGAAAGEARARKQRKANMKDPIHPTQASRGVKGWHKDQGNGLPAEYSHIPLTNIEFLAMAELRDIAKQLNARGATARGKPLAGRDKRTLVARIREYAASEGARQGASQVASKAVAHDAKAAHQTHLALVDEMNAKIAEIEMGGGKLSTMDLAAMLPEIATQMFKEMMADAAALRKVGVSPAAIADVLGGMSRQRVAAASANHLAFSEGMSKVFANPKVKAMLEGMPDEMKAQAAQFAEKLQKTPNMGDRFAMLKEVEMGKTMETQHMVYPPSKGASPHIAKFTVNELISLYRELLTAKEGIFVPGRGTMTTLQRGYDSLKQQAVAKWGNKAMKAQEGLVSARGEFYTPAEMMMLKQLIDTAKHDFPELTARTNVLAEEFADASVKFRMDVSPDARKASAAARKYTLEDHGMTAREQPGFRGKPGEQGYFNLEAFNLLDPLRKKWAAKKDAYKRPKASSTYKVRNAKGKKVAGKSYTGGAVTRKEMTKRSFIREYVFGGKMIGALQRESVRHMDDFGKYSLARLTAMLDQFPKAMWREKMGNVQSFYQLHTKAFADLIADSGNGVSLAATLAPFQGKFLTGVRRYMGYLPGGLTMQRIKHSTTREAFMDLTSGDTAQTPLGSAMRSYGDYLYRYGQENGIEMATYLRNWYPVILRGLNKKQREQFVALAEAKAKTPQQRARAREQVEHIFDLAFENGGLIPAEAKPGMNGKHLNAELRRQFFDRFTMEELRPFIVNDPGKAMYSYAKGMARRVANNARWGAKEEIWKGAVADAVKEAQEVGRPLSKEDLATLEAGRQILAHTYMTAPGWYIGMMRMGVAWQNAAKLGLVTVGSLAEIGVGLLNPTMQKHYAKALVTTGLRGTVQNTARAIWRDVPQARGRRLAEAIGRSVDVEMHDVLTATHAADLQSVGSGIVFQLNGLHALTNMLQDINVAAFEGALREATVKEFNHRLGRRKKTDFDRADADFLAMYGIDMEAAMAWHRDGGKIGGAFWDQQYAPALLKYLNDTVMTPRGVNMPRWMSNPWLTPIRHLMTYTSVFANTVLPDMLWNLKGGVRADAPHNLTLRGARGAKAAGGVAAIYGLGMLAENLLDEIKYGGQDEHPLKDRIKDDDVWAANQIARYLNRTGVYGLGVAKLFDAYESYHYGRTDYRFIDGAFLTEASAGAEVLGLGLLAGEIDAKQAAKWLVRNGIPVHAATIPRDKKAPLAEFMPTRQQMEDDLARWLADHVPGVDRKSEGKWKP